MTARLLLPVNPDGGQEPSGGSAGPPGSPGQGVPVGGGAGTGLLKVSGTNYDTAWVDVATQTELDAALAGLEFDAPSLLRTADWWVTAQGNLSPVMYDRTGEGVDGDFDPPGAVVRVVNADAWAGPALIGEALLDAGIVAWPAADFDVRWTATVHPTHGEGADAGCEIFVAPVDPGVTPGVYLKPMFEFLPDGVLAVSVAWQPDTDTTGAYWSSADANSPVGDWRDGVAEADWRLTIDVDDGAGGTVFTVYKDAVQVATEVVPTVGLEPFVTAPATTELHVGTTTGHLVAIRAAELRDGIGGTVLYAFDADTPTGWTTLQGSIGTPPQHPSWYAGGTGTGYHTNGAVFDIGAGDSVTWMWRFTPADTSATTGAIPFVRDQAGLGGGGAGWFLIDAPPFGIEHRFRIGDAGGDAVMVDLDPFTHAETTVAVTLNRADDTLTAWRDGVLVDSVDASALDAVATNADVIVGTNGSLTATAAFYRRALDAGEHATLHTEVSAWPSTVGSIIVDAVSPEDAAALVETERLARIFADGELANDTATLGATVSALSDSIDGAYDSIDILIGVDTALDGRLDTAEATLADHESRIAALEPP
jgi:hypothetical protein